MLLLSCPSLAACAHQNALKGCDSEFDSDKTGAELQVQLPVYLKAGNVLPFDPGLASDNLHYIDAPSIVVGEDNIVRYTLMIKSRQGATNVSYEDMQCAIDGAGKNVRAELLVFKLRGTAKRLYAIARDDKSWVSARTSKWVEPRRCIAALCATGAFQLFLLSG